MGSSGLTPLAVGQNGLGTSGNSQKGGPVRQARQPEEERLRRLHEVQQLLKTRIAGRGICREGVERIARESSFTFAWLEENILNIAGNCVDLEIEFDATQRDLVKDVVLKISTAGVEEQKTEASHVLKQDLAQVSVNSKALPWHSLDNFSFNLGRLAHLDHLSKGINCFEAIDGLYLSFRKIWEEEKHRLHNKQEIGHICRGTIGRPAMGKRGRLGLSLDYWICKRELRQAAMTTQDQDAMDLDESEGTAEKIPGDVLWTSKLNCETGYPPLRIAKDWVGEGVFSEQPQEDNVEGTYDEKNLWLEPPPTLVSASAAEDGELTSSEEAGAVAGISIPKPPNIRFVFELLPSVLLPGAVISGLRSQSLTMTILAPQNARTYARALSSQSSGIISSSGRWERSLKTYPHDGQEKQTQHSYTLHTPPNQWWHSLQSLSFEHPRQLAELIPVLRQYALLWSLLRNTSKADKLATPEQMPAAPKPAKSREPRKRSNRKPEQTRLEQMLNGTSEGARAQPVTINLEIESDTMAKLDLIFPLPKSKGAAFGTVGVEVRRGGDVVVREIMGVEVEVEAASRVLGISEDLGVLVQWVLDRVLRG